MAVAGYSGTPLLKKLGIAADTKILLLNAPADYADLLEADISKQLCKKNETPDLVHLFSEKKILFEKKMQELISL
jgi:hypothetical protein